MKDHTLNIIDCHLLSTNMWAIWLCVFPSGEVQVYLWMFRCGNIVLATTRFFVVAKLPKRRSNSCLAENWLVSQGGLCSVKEASMGQWDLLNRRNNAGVSASAVSSSFTAAILENFNISEFLKDVCLANISSNHTEAMVSFSWWQNAGSTVALTLDRMT